MAITFDKADIAGLVALIKDAIDNKHIQTWEYDEDGDFTHTAASGQWKNKAWLSGRPTVNAFVILGPKGGITRGVYAVYHGRFIEMLLDHFHSQFNTVTASAKPAVSDCTVIERATA
jgi:hypothetical protein